MSCADVIIIGGGFAGLSAAAAFVAAGAEVSVLEALDRPLPTFRGELLHPPGVSALRELGLNDALDAAGAVPVRGFSVSSPDGRSEAVLPYGGS
ncbi:MAG TPA: FAD-dependent monooxygenase, partial [Polyangiaceae bacterium]